MNIGGFIIFFKLILQMLIGAIFVFFTIWMVIDFFHFDLSFFSMGLSVVFFIISYYLTIVIHELGHVMAGKMKGMEFYFFLMGPILFYQDYTNKRRVTFKKHGLKIAGAASLRIDPTEKRAPIKKQLYFFMLGGGVTNIFVGLISFICAFVFSSVFLFILSLLNLIVGPMNLLMKESPDFIPDGGCLIN